jgi:hypothetical protein
MKIKIETTLLWSVSKRFYYKPEFIISKNIIAGHWLAWYFELIW